MPSKDKRRALQVFHGMVTAGYCLDTKRTKVGYITNRLKPEDREVLKHLKSEDLQHRIK